MRGTQVSLGLLPIANLGHMNRRGLTTHVAGAAIHYVTSTGRSARVALREADSQRHRLASSLASYAAHASRFSSSPSVSNHAWLYVQLHRRAETSFPSTAIN